MLFSSPVFIFLFLPIVLTLYFVFPRKLRNLFLLIFSLVFYYWGEKRYALVMVVSIIGNFSFAMLLSKFRKNILLLIFAVCLNLLLLIIYKYTNIYSHLPLGLSFLTFHAISYLFDIYRRNVSASVNIVDTALYISFFPQLIAGPIVRYRDIASQLVKRVVTTDKFFYGIERFVFGLGKKVLIANTVGQVADQIFLQSGSNLNTSTAWLGIVCYTLQIYFDFSGYSDMAIGLARMFGFEFLENFNYPYISRSITEFWRRWHISLSNWFRDYLYIPLGGSRSGSIRTYLNLIIVFLLCGIWHGNNLTFVVWGIWHGLFLIIERIFDRQFLLFPKIIKHIYTLLVIMIGWVFFRSDSLGNAFNYFHAMVRLGSYTDVVTYLNRQVILALVVAILFSAPISRFFIRIKLFFIPIIFFLSVISLAGSTYNPFIYFRF